MFIRQTKDSQNRTKKDPLNSAIVAPNKQRNLPQESIAYFPLIDLVSGLCGAACAKVLEKKIGSKVSKRAVHLFFYCLVECMVFQVVSEKADFFNITGKDKMSLLIT